MEPEGIHEQFDAPDLGVRVLRPRSLFLAAAILAAALAGRGTLSPAAPAAKSVSEKAAPIEDYGGLPVGKGREVVFGLCQACHSLAIVKQQGLNRDSWDETLKWMVEEQGMPALDPTTRNLVLDYLATHFGR